MPLVVLTPTRLKLRALTYEHSWQSCDDIAIQGETSACGNGQSLRVCLRDRGGHMVDQIQTKVSPIACLPTRGSGRRHVRNCGAPDRLSCEISLDGLDEKSAVNLRADCLIVGGGPAGLTATTYLGRFQRSVLLVDRGESRAWWIPVSHDILGFGLGVTGPELLDSCAAKLTNMAHGELPDHRTVKDKPTVRF
jgi:hypothetical protein